MMDIDKVWLVPETEGEIEIAKKLIGNSDEYAKVEIRYSQLKELLILDYIQIGSYEGNIEIFGNIGLNNHVFLSVKGFEPKITINTVYFKEFLKYLTKGLKMKYTTVVTFYYAINKPVIVEVENKKGVIAPTRE